MTSTSLRTNPHNRPLHYAPVSKTLHWVTAVLVLGLIPAGIVMVNIGEGALQNLLFNMHRSFGVVVFALALWRVAARIAYGAPAAAAGLTRFERVASTTVHYALYALLIAQPVVGWLMTSAYPVDVSVFGLFTLPHLVHEDKALFEALQRAHFVGGLTMAGLVLVHIGAALKHTFVDKDTVLWRMLPRSWGG
ncbi:MAG: cytochrome [Hyphomicrobiales bacterium]|nr:cytochrome [Hyphomicrobiales bacterium]